MAFVCFVHGYILSTQNHADVHADAQRYTLLNACPLVITLHTKKVIQESIGWEMILTLSLQTNNY